MSDLFGLFRFAQLALIVGLIGAAVAASTEVEVYKGYEMPPYEVLERDSDAELRRYAPHILAEVSVNGNRTTAIGRGFQVLANYIFGGNATGEKIAMTVPVSQAPVDGTGDSWTVSFMMPASFEIDALPAAKTDAIQFVETDTEELLVREFSGFRSGTKLADETRAILAEAKERGLTVVGAPRYFFYDGPMTPPWARRNEVALPVTQ
ncbi:MAG: heme-binding protein [Pseudomonadota bacterium]